MNMQLNNKTNGYVAIIERWNLVNCNVNLFENSMMVLQRKPIKKLVFKINLDLSTIGISTLTIEENILKLIYNQILNNYPELNGFELSNDEYNWLFELRPIRVTLNKQLVLESIYQDDILGQLFLAMRSLLSEYIINDENILTVYLEELYPEHRLLFESYPNEIYIDELL